MANVPNGGDGTGQYFTLAGQKRRLFSTRSIRVSFTRSFAMTTESFRVGTTWNADNPPRSGHLTPG